MMENGLNEVHLSPLDSEDKPLKIVGGVYLNNNGKTSSIRIPSPTKKGHDLMFIDDGAVYSPSASPEKQLHVGENGETMTNILRNCVESPPPSPPMLLKSCQMTSALSHRLPTVVVLGYQRVVAESQAAAERMNQQQQHFLHQNSRSVDCPLTLSIGSSGLLDQGLPATPHGRNNRVNCHSSDDLHYFARLPSPQSPPTNSLDNASIPQPAALFPSTSSPSITVSEIESSYQSESISPPCGSPVKSMPQWSMLDSRPVTDDAETIAESVYHQPPKAADRSAAYRLARRLFTLDGFKMTDVAKHLCKRNDFSQLVGEEFMSFFDFTGQAIDTALRHFMTKFALTGETQDRERILFHFSRRYVTCNPDVFVSDDACHTMVCALMLLNTDLHNQNVTRKMSCSEFVSNLMELNNGEYGYSQEELKRLYDAFKQEPLKWPIVEVPTFNLMYGVPSMGPVSPLLGAGVYGFGMNGLATPNDIGFVSPSPLPPPPPPPLSNYAGDSSTSFAAIAGGCASSLSQSATSHLQTASGNYGRPALFNSNHEVTLTKSPSPGVANAPESGNDLLKLFTNPFANMPKDICAKEYMRGFVMRKCVMQSHGKRTTMGKRNWKLFYARLRDLGLYFYKDAEAAAAATRAEEMSLNYMKHIYRFQLHCHHLRFHHEQHQRLQAAAAAAASTVHSTDSSPSAGDASAPATEKSESALKMGIDRAEVVEATVNVGKDELGDERTGLKNSDQSLPLPQIPASNIGVPGMSSILEQQLIAAAFQLPPPPPPPPPPEGVVCIAHAFACVAEGYVKKPNVYCLKTKDGSEFLIQVNDAKELQHWVDKINYVAGLLSTPSLPSAVGSDRTFHRPILPSGVTHLTVYDQLEGHQRRIQDLTRDLADLRRRRMSAPSQPNLTCLSWDSTATSPAPSIRSESAVRENEVHQQLQQPPSGQLPYIPDSVLKSLTPSSAATLPSSATHHPERSFSSAFSTASLGRRRKKSFNTPHGGTSSELTAQRVELDERVAFLEHELNRYKTYTRLLEAELSRLQRLPPPQMPSSPHLSSALPVCGTSSQVRGFWQVCGSADLCEEPPVCDSGGVEGWKPSTWGAGLPPLTKRGYSPSMGFGNCGGMRQPQSSSSQHRMQYRYYQMQRRQQQQQLFSPGPPLPPQPPMTAHRTHQEEEVAPTTAQVEQENAPRAFYEAV